ncbi:argininosuccinate lyase [bacterium M21]|nr:argininosuccinate lyase [bacterium M21]
MALWGGRFSEKTNELLAKLSESVSYDQRMYAHDIQGSIAHARMLKKQSIIPAEDADKIVEELGKVKEEIDAGEFEFKTELEDIHMNIESRLIERAGDAGARVHTARSRNDQVATDIRLYLRDEVSEIVELIEDMQRAMVEVAAANDDVILPGFTHLQHAQPVLFAHHLLAYVEMLSRDVSRFEDAKERFNFCPLGSGALAGSTFPVDRDYTANQLGFDGPMRNSMDAVSDRDFAIELLSDMSLLMMHLSRLSEDIIFWKSQEADFIELGDAFCTGSSIMPQKKNPDMAELTRGKTARVYGALTSLLTLMKGLPLCYNRDMQEDKEQLFDSIDTVKLVLMTAAPMMRSMTAKKEKMLASASEPALMATDLAEWLVKQGMPFRTAHHRVGSLVAWCNDNAKPMNELTLAEMQISVPEAKEECTQLFDPVASVNARDIFGATAPNQVKKQIVYWQAKLDEEAGE